MFFNSQKFPYLMEFHFWQSFVNMSATCYLDLQWWSWMSPLPIASHMKWYLMLTCLVLLWYTEFFAMSITDLLSQNSFVPSSCFFQMSSKILRSQIAWEVANEAEIYPDSTVDNATDCCFFDAQENQVKSITRGAFYIMKTTTPITITKTN